VITNDGEAERNCSDQVSALHARYLAARERARA
jgi:hypothetical protein